MGVSECAIVISVCHDSINCSLLLMVVRWQSALFNYQLQREHKLLCHCNFTFALSKFSYSFRCVQAKHKDHWINRLAIALTRTIITHNRIQNHKIYSQIYIYLQTKMQRTKEGKKPTHTGIRRLNGSSTNPKPFPMISGSASEAMGLV